MLELARIMGYELIFIHEFFTGDAADHPDSELDSGISVNGNYDQIEPSNRNGGQIRNFNGLQNYERIEELHGKVNVFLHILVTFFQKNDSQIISLLKILFLYR